MKIGALAAVKDSFTTPRAVELLVQNVPQLPPGTQQAWEKLLGYAGSCYRFVGDTYGERLRIIKEDWAVEHQGTGEEEAEEVDKDASSDNGKLSDDGKGTETFSFGINIFTDFFARSAASQDLFKQSQSRLRYIADRVLQSSYDMFQKNKDETLDELSALGLRHVGYGIPIELFGPFSEVCVEVMRPLIQEFPNSNSSTKLVWCPKDNAHQSGAHATAKAMIEDVLTIRADRDNYYYGADELFKYQPNIADNILREAPFLAETLLEGLIWRSHKSQEMLSQSDNLRPVIYYVKHLLQDPDEDEMLSRAMISYVRFNHPQTIMHPILTFSLDLLWERMAKWFFLKDRVLTMFNCALAIHTSLHDSVEILCSQAPQKKQMKQLANWHFGGMMQCNIPLLLGVIFIVSQCLLNNRDALEDPTTSMVVASIERGPQVYCIGFGRLLYWHARQIFLSFKHKDFALFWGFWVPRYLTNGSHILGFLLMLDLLAMATVEPIFYCLGDSSEVDSQATVRFYCDAWTDEMRLVYEAWLEHIGTGVEIFTILGVFIYVLLIVEVGSISVRLSEYRVLCLHAMEQVMLCLAVIFITIAAFAFAISGMTREESPLLVIVIVLFLMATYTFFFNLLVSQKRGKWQKFMDSLNLEKRVDFETGDIGLAGGIKDFEPALAHPVAKDQIIRFGGHTDPSLPWPEKIDEDRSLEQNIQKTIQKSLQKFLGKSKVGSLSLSGADSGSMTSSSKKSE
eukprot:Skav233319  [mRNA]  locus=scaffold3767:250250:260784:- [translate_table: standard]